MVDKIFLCVYYTFWSILNIFKNKIIFTQNQVRHRPSKIFFSRRPLRVILARFEQFVAAHHCTKKIFFWSICLLLHYNQPPIIGTMPIRDIGELPYPHLLCWRAMKVNRSHSVRTNSIFAINSSIVSQNYFNGSHLSPNNTRTCHQLICVDFVTKCRS